MPWGCNCIDKNCSLITASRLRVIAVKQTQKINAEGTSISRNIRRFASNVVDGVTGVSPAYARLAA